MCSTRILSWRKTRSLHHLSLRKPPTTRWETSSSGCSLVSRYGIYGIQSCLVFFRVSIYCQHVDFAKRQTSFRLAGSLQLQPAALCYLLDIIFSFWFAFPATRLILLHRSKFCLANIRGSHGSSFLSNRINALLIVSALCSLQTLSDRVVCDGETMLEYVDGCCRSLQDVVDFAFIFLIPFSFFLKYL